MKNLNSLKLILTLASLSLLTACSQGGRPAADGRIAGNILGGEASSSDFQKEHGIVLLAIITEPENAPGSETPPPDAEPGMSICTGSLITRRVILTADHCIRAGKLRNILAVFTTELEKIGPETKIIQVVDLELNPSVGSAPPGESFETSASHHDVVLLVLSEDAPEDFKLAQLPSENTPALKAGDKILSAGYGITDPITNLLVINPLTNQIYGLIPNPDAVNDSGVLRQVDGLEVLAVNADGGEFMMSDNKGTKGTCFGDSGGPSYLRQEDGSLLLVGITSRGTALTGNCDTEGIYGSVAAEMPWIHAALAKIEAPPAPEVQEPAPETPHALAAN